MGVIESVESAKQRLGQAYDRLSAPRTYAKVGLIAGGGLLSALLLRRLLSSCKSAPAAAVVKGGGGSPFSSLLVQALTVLIFPWLRARLMDSSSWGGMLKDINPSRYFFRWLGLEK